VENLPRPFERLVLVCNHQSALVIFLMSYIHHYGYLPFRVVFKREPLFYPGLGQAMWLARYFSVNRHDKDSGRNMLRSAADYIGGGGSVFFFPEGTRKIDGSTGPLGPFKPGAFKLALETGARILPITISGARSMFPASGLPRLEPGHPILTIHPSINTAGRTLDSLMEESRAAIASALRPEDDLPAPRPAPASDPKKAE